MGVADRLADASLRVIDIGNQAHKALTQASQEDPELTEPANMVQFAVVGLNNLTDVSLGSGCQLYLGCCFCLTNLLQLACCRGMAVRVLLASPGPNGHCTSGTSLFRAVHGMLDSVGIEMGSPVPLQMMSSAREGKRNATALELQAAQAAHGVAALEEQVRLTFILS